MKTIFPLLVYLTYKSLALLLQYIIFASLTLNK